LSLPINSPVHESESTGDTAMPKRRHKPIGLFAAALACIAAIGSAQAAETGFSIYPLGGMAFEATATVRF